MAVNEASEADRIPIKIEKANRPRQTRNEAIILPMQSRQFVTVTTLLRKECYASFQEKEKRVIRIRQWNYCSWNVTSYAYFAVMLSKI